MSPGPHAADPPPVPRRHRVAVALATVLVGCWGVRWIVGPELSPGADTTGHLQRVDFAARELFGAGRLDGWFPGAMLGYQTFLVYGPGLSVAVGLVQVLTLGTVSSAGALKVVLVAGWLAVPGATAALARALGLRWWTAAGAGMLALAVSSARGGGIEGSFETALVSQQVAVPLVLLALALAVDCCRGGAVARPRLLAGVVTALALTHPLSLGFLGLLGPLVLAAAVLSGAVARPRWRPLATAVAWTAGLAAWWWLPVLVHRDLRGPGTSWDLPGVGEHVKLLATGERGWRGWAGPVVAGSTAGAALIGLATRRRDLLALGALPVAALGLLHALHGALGLHDALGIQLTNRGLVYVALLGAPVAARVLQLVVGVAGPGRGWLVWPVAAVCAVQAIGGLHPPDWARQRPTPTARQVAAHLAAEVPDGARFAFVPGDDSALGVPAAARWLAWASGRDGLAPFAAELAPGAGEAMSAGRLPPGGVGVGWVDRLRALAVTHVVSADEATNARLARVPSVTAELVAPPVAVWALRAEPGRPVGSVVPADEARVLIARLDRVAVEVTSEQGHDGLALAVGYSPGWRAHIDGRPVPLTATHDGRLALDLPVGTHVVDLRFRETAWGPAARVVTVAAAVALVATGRARRGGDGRRSRPGGRAALGPPGRGPRRPTRSRPPS